MTVITGETGAGKTLLVDALELLCGGRADPSSVREGAAEARVEGRFVSAAEDEEVVLARVVPVVGRSRGYVDGRLATVGRARRGGAHASSTCTVSTRTSRCSHPSEQRALLDRASGAPAAAAHAELRDARGETRRRLDDELAALGGDERAACARDRPAALPARPRSTTADDHRRATRTSARGGGGDPRRRRGAP